jgi:hypothetical protein
METEDDICKRYEAEFAAIAAVDRRYYLIPSVSVDERREYAARKDRLEELRSQFYAELAKCRERALRHVRPCRSFIRGFRRSGAHFAGR